VEKQARKILHFHYYFPPAGTVGTFRNYNIAMELSKVFESSHLITVRNKPFLLEEHFDLEFIDIHEVQHWDYRVMSEKISRDKDLNDRVNAKRAGRTFGWSRKLLDTYPGNLIWGEGGWLYIRKALKKARQLIREEGITHLYSSFRPMADHYIAHRLKKEFPALVWIADFRDLPVDRNRDNVFFPKWQDRRYRKLFSRADLLTTVSEGLRKRLLDYHEEILVLRNGVRRLFLPENPQLPDQFTITYTGSLYPKLQDPAAFFASLREIIHSGLIPENDLRLIYAGKDHRIWKGYIQQYGLEDIAVVKGKVSLTASLRLQHESHLNLLLTWVGPYSGGILTGKLSEYLAAGRPILCLINGKKEDELDKMASELDGFSAYYPEDTEQIQKHLLDVYQSRINKQDLSKKRFEKYGQEHSWASSVAMLLDELPST
jgi:glycosyltransferase involved in cell wall biosynthesis